MLLSQRRKDRMQMIAIDDLLVCPECHCGKFEHYRDIEGTYPTSLRSQLSWEVVCVNCRRRYPVTSDYIPLLWSDKLRSIYVNNEFEPNCVNPDERDVKIANIVFYDEVSEEYIEEVHVDKIFRGRFLQAINMVVNPPFSIHPDVGCGPGNILGLTTGLAETRIGIDISLRALRIARERTRTVVILGDADRLPIRSMACQLVTASSVLHHLYDPSLFLAEGYRVLQPGGGLVTDCDPNRVAADFSAAARFLYSLRLPIYRCLSAFSGRFFAHRDRNLQRWGALAEYHNKPGCGFKVEELKDRLKATGFDVVLVHMHNMNESKIVENSFVSPPVKHIMLQVLCSRNPWCRSNGTTILTVSRRGYDNAHSADPSSLRLQ